MTDERQIATAQGNGDSTGVELQRFAHLHDSHLRTLFVNGTFAGATVKFQISIDDVTYFDVSGADAITAKTLTNVEFRAPFVRINVAGGGGTEAIDAWLV